MPGGPQRQWQGSSPGIKLATPEPPACAVVGSGLGSPHARSSPPAAGRHRRFPQITPSGEREVGGQAAGENPEGWPGGAGTGAAAPKGEAHDGTVLGQRQCNDHPKAMCQLSPVPSPSPPAMARSRDILPAPSKSEHQTHPPRLCPLRCHRQPWLCRVTRFRLIRRRLISPPGDVCQAAFGAGAGFNSRGTQEASGVTDKLSPTRRPQRQGQGQVWGLHQLRTLPPSKAAKASSTQGSNISLSFFNLAGTRGRAHPAAGSSGYCIFNLIYLQEGKHSISLKKNILKIN